MQAHKPGAYMSKDMAKLVDSLPLFSVKLNVRHAVNRLSLSQKPMDPSTRNESTPMCGFIEWNEETECQGS